jgi:rare lipoprotein A
MHKLGGISLVIGFLVSQQPVWAWPDTRQSAPADSSAQSMNYYVEEGYYEPNLKAIREDGPRQSLKTDSYGQLSSNDGDKPPDQGDRNYAVSQLIVGKFVSKYVALHKQSAQSEQALVNQALQIWKGAAMAPGIDTETPMASSNDQAAEANIQSALREFASQAVVAEAPLSGSRQSNPLPRALSSQISDAQSQPLALAKLVPPPLSVQAPPPGSRSVASDLSLIVQADKAPPAQYQPVASDLPAEEQIAQAPAPGIHSVTPPKPSPTALAFASAEVVPVVVIPPTNSYPQADGTGAQSAGNQAPPPGANEHFYAPRPLYQASAISSGSLLHIPDAELPSQVTVQLAAPSLQPPSLLNDFSGVASWYGGRFLGRKTASGELFAADRLTAASRYLPFGTKLFIHNKKSGKSVIVTVNDRGPFVGKRILDLSPAAARRLDMVHSGLANVEVQIVKDGLMAVNEAAP